MVTETIVEEGETIEVTRVIEVPADGSTLVFWSTETQPERAEATQAIIDRFAEQTGINVELVLTDEDSLPNLMTAAVAAGTLPNAVFGLLRTSTDGRHHVLCLQNVADEPVELRLPIADLVGRPSVIVDMLTAEQFRVTSGWLRLTLGGYGVRWLRPQ